jgi:hypothetical protein
MATFEAQVEALTSLSIDGSSAPTQTELTQFLTDGAKEVINSFSNNDELLAQCAAKQSTFTSAALESEAEALNTGKILSVYMTDSGATYPCRKINASQKYYYADSSAFASSQMEKATVTDPVYYIQNNFLNAIPASKTVGYSEVQYPAVAYGDSAVASFPDEAEYLVALYAAIKSLQNAMGNKTASLPADISFPSIPVAPSSPSFDTGAISISTSVPTYTSPVFSAPTLESIGDLTLPVAPAVPSLSAQSVTITGTAPAYVGPSYSQIDTYIDTDEDVELAQAKLQEVSSQIQDSLNRFNDANVEYQAKLQKDLQDAQLSDANEARKLQKYSNEVQTYSAEVNAKVQEWVNEEWTQKFQKYQQDYSLKLQEYNTNLQNALNNFNKENTLYQNELQEKIQEANNQQTKDSAEYSAKIQKYSNEMQSYSAEVNKSVQDFNTKLQKHSTDYQWLQSQYAQLKSDYNYGLQLLLGRPLTAGEQQRR